VHYCITTSSVPILVTSMNLEYPLRLLTKPFFQLNV
jgi:hypothetical protein